MMYAQFIERVAEQMGSPLGQAETLTQATLLTLADRISGGEARDLAAQLPQELREFLTRSQEPAEAFDLEDFIARVRLRAGVDADTAKKGVEAVFKTLYAAVSTGEFEDVMAQLPKEFQNLVPAVVRRR
ncbi:DUF2267 domain-containing protein [Planosporangium flavigriseum]|uniref:DUF2267 domain-containing protein n=1 Tax=Planosporangium flavigriseum TaxID=373681 RepID=A0A8J3PKG5_9ACTN|nr:DUF2267 domain-containing protein [Planosporangium flavigriseum]NJC64634.1 DUF2267 domain-containing protein [Planosporangium flavigriseum]GIG71883.1 hypothetical protein Pfl04_02870 [Planosporangium flavigriseum]